MNESTVDRINRQAAERRDRGERAATPNTEARSYLAIAIAAWHAEKYEAATAAAAIATAIVTVG